MSTKSLHPSNARAGRRDPLSELCHDLGQRAAMIGALVAALEVECDLLPVVRIRLGQITAEAGRLSDLCHHVIRSRRTIEPTALDRLAVEIVAGAAATARGAAVTFSGGPVTTDCDATAVRRAIANLVDNASRAAGRSGDVVVSTSASPGWAHVIVEDSGPGFGLGPTGAAGLGLRIVAGVAAEHRGTVAYGKSEGLGGAKVVLSIPAAQSARDALARCDTAAS